MLDLPAIKKLCGAVPCLNPRFEPAEYVTHDMAIDAGEPTREGTLLCGALYEPCQDCNGCRLRTLVPQLVTALEEVQGKLDAVEEAWEFVHLAILDSDTHPRHGYGDCDSCDAIWDMLIVMEHCILKGEK
ncbi:hypothetical protein LCGC14_2193850 [marine sediment metagenome]|uniref:Uncharacterized protein n=1 Tax=marine sediment metagenome TaxID=412755 RepID=A0A0F9E5S8_9ZZZZ